MSVSVAPDEGKGPGHATIRVSGAAGAADGGFRIFRDPDWPEPNLGPAGWQGAEAVLRPDEVAREGADLLLRVGPAVCDRLEEGIFFFALPATGVNATVAWPEMEAVHAGAGTMFAVRPQPVAAPVADPVAAPVPPVPPPPSAPLSGFAPAPAAPLPVAVVPPGVAAKRGWVPLVAVAAVVVAAAAAAGGWWWLHRPGAAPVETPARVEPAPPAPPPTSPVLPPAPPPDPPAPPAAADLDAMSVRDLVARGNNADMLDQARRRLAVRPQDSLLLLETAGEDRHDGAALTLLAQLYDPNKPRQGGIGADARQAAKDYRDAERNNDHSGAADREALHQALLAARDRGDTGAKLIEGDFWP